MVRELIRREFEVGLSVVSVGRLLAKMDLSRQRPLYRAYQQDSEAVRRWKEEEYPAIAAQATAEGATIYFADEAGIRSDHHAGSTWAPIGHTPVVAATGERFSVNMISAVTAKGALRFAVFEGTTTAASMHRTKTAMARLPAWTITGVRSLTPVAGWTGPAVAAPTQNGWTSY